MGLRVVQAPPPEQSVAKRLVGIGEKMQDILLREANREPKLSGLDLLRIGFGILDTLICMVTDQAEDVDGSLPELHRSALITLMDAWGIDPMQLAVDYAGARGKPER